MPGFPVHHRLPELIQTLSIKSVIPSNLLILCRPLLLPPSIFPSIRVFSTESTLRIRWPKYWSFSFNISPSNEHPGLISFRMDWLDLLADQGTLKSLLQHHSSKASILWRSAFFIVQLSHPYMTTGNTIALTRAIKNKSTLSSGDDLLMRTCLSQRIFFIPLQKRRGNKKKRLVQSPSSYFMDVKCPGCYKITTVFSHAQKVVLCVGCSTVLCQPTGGKARLIEGCSFRQKQH